MRRPGSLSYDYGTVPYTVSLKPLLWFAGITVAVLFSMTIETRVKPATAADRCAGIWRDNKCWTEVKDPYLIQQLNATQSNLPVILPARKAR